LETAQARYDQLLKPKPDAVLPLQAAVDSAAAQMETAKKLLAAATIMAPFDGQISQLNGDVGTQIASNTVVFILLNPRTLRIDANVDQAYVSDLRAAQTANVTFDALQGRAYQATVTAVGLTPTVQQGVVSYVVTMGIDTTRIPQGTPVPTPGMTASITIVTNRTENALSVPARSVRRIGRNQTVTVKTPTGTEQRTVTTGATNGTLIQITNGLQDSDQVVVTAPAAGGTTTRPGGGGGPVQFGPGGGG
jgi:RND family efflux transporter MFP subunit